LGLLSEGFTVLAVLEARDLASEIFEKCGATMERFGEQAEGTADAVKTAADQIDESLATTASGVDPLELAAAKVSAAEDQMAAATENLIEKQRALVAVSGNVASLDAQAAAAEDVAVAQQRAAEAAAEQTAALAAQREALAAAIAESGDLAAVEQAVASGAAEGSAALTALAEANERAAAAEKLNADAAAEASAAQARQDALVTSDDVASAANGLTTAEKGAASASKDLSAAQKQQAAVQKAVAMSTDEAKAAALEEAAAQKEAAANSEAFSSALSGVGKVAAIGALGLGVAGALMVKSAGDFQDSTAHLQTDAGVSAKNLGMIRAGILNVSTATGQSASSITDAMYHIASSGFTGANGLNILKVAAEGARVGGADLDTTSKALVGTMTAYYGTSLSAGQATKDSTSLMNQLIETVGVGDMRMQDLASSLSTVTPIAAAAKIPFAEVGGAIATMTAQGMTARQATQDLANTIRNLKSPNNVASAEMKALGLNANEVSQNLGKTGLSGTLNQLRNAVLSNSQGGVVMLGYLKEMSPAAQSLSNQIMAGSISTGNLTNAVKLLNPEQAALVTKFKTAATSATGLQQTYTGAMGKMLGGSTGLNTALMLTGSHMTTMTKNTAAIAAKAKDASGNVDNWSTIQGTFNFKVSQAKTGIENTGIAIGSALLPAVSAVLSAITKVIIPVAEWTAKHKTLTEILFVGVTALLAVVAAVVLVGKTFKAVSNAVGEVQKAYKGAVAVLQKLSGQSKQTADQQAKDAKKAAAAQEEASEESAGAAETAAGQEEAASGEAAAAAETDAGEMAAANEEAAATSSGSWVTAAAATVGGWAKAGGQMIVSAAKWVAQGAVKVGAYVAANVAGAAVTMAAWIAANAVLLLGIGLVIAAVVIAVVEIVKHWKTITAAVSKVWDDVYDFISGIISDVISFVKSHWTLIVGIITGPLGLAVIEIVKHWDQIKSFVSAAVNDVINFVKQHWRLIISILGGPLGLAVALVTKYWGDIRHWFTEGVSTVLSILRGLAHDVVSVGEDVVRGIWSGISGMGGWLWGQVKSFASSTLHSFESALGIGSPSKYTTVHGQMLGLGLAGGILSSIPKVAAAARQMAGAALTGTSSLSANGGGIGSSLALSAVGPAGGGASAGTQVNVYVTGNTVMSDADISKLTAKIGQQVAAKILPQAGRKINIRG
jgi:TP901 family phage tail tape measure protein